MYSVYGNRSLKLSGNLVTRDYIYDINLEANHLIYISHYSYTKTLSNAYTAVEIYGYKSGHFIYSKPAFIVANNG